MYRILSTTIAVFIATATFEVSAQQPTRGLATPRASARAVVPSGSSASLSSPFVPGLLPGTRSNIFATIRGNALNSTNGALPSAAVRLRDALAGRIVDTQRTDESGFFGFRPVDPGAYIVEIVGNDQSILAASQLLIAETGEAVSAVVKLPFRIPPLAGLLGHAVQSAAAVSSAAATSGVLAATGTTQVSPQ